MEVRTMVRRGNGDAASRFSPPQSRPFFASRAAEQVQAWPPLSSSSAPLQMQVAIDRAARFGHSLERLASPSGGQPIQREVVGTSGENLWATEIAGRVLEETDLGIVKKIRLLHSLPKKFQVASYDDLVKGIKSGEFDKELDAPPSDLYRATGNSPEELMGSRKSTAEMLGLSAIVFKKADKVNMDKWYGDHGELAGSHHKFPKRTLGWLHSHMTPEQVEKMNQKLHLDPKAGPTALARLRSNLIPWGTKQVASDKRRDDPEHTGESLDLVTLEKSGQLSPRSRSYMNLAFSYQDIVERMGGSESTLTDKEADEVTSHLHAAEVAHYAIEKDPKQPADYGQSFWTSAPDSKTGRQWIKGMVPASKYTGVQPDPQKYDIDKQREKEERRKKEPQPKNTFHYKEPQLKDTSHYKEQPQTKNTPHYGLYAYAGHSERLG